MKYFLFLAGATTLCVTVALSFAEHAYAATETDSTSQQNVRRARGADFRYQYNKRRIEAGDDFTTASGSNSTFDRRADYLRDAKQRMIQQEIEARKYSNERRSSPTYYERENRSASTSLRRLNEAQIQGGIRLRRGTSSLRQLQDLNSAEKLQRLQDYRQEIKEAEANRYNFDDGDCGRLSGRRLAQCRYEQRTD